MRDANEIIRQMRDEGLFARKSLGQHFLCDDGALASLADNAAPPGSTVLEIGPGPGLLTQQLCKRARQVVAIEVDTGMSPYLSAIKSGAGNLEVVFADALKADWSALMARFLPNEQFYIAGNLPYYITTSLLEKALDANLPIKGAVFLMQREAAQRLMAGPGSKQYGPLSLLMKSRADATELFDLPPEAFVPAPKVHSRAVALAMKPCEPEWQRFLMKTAHAAFLHRRKTLRNGLKAALSASQEVIDSIASRLGLAGDARAEQLTYEQFAKLAETLRDEGLISIKR